MAEQHTMDLLKTAESPMAMDDRTWQRHTNPWSVYTRFNALPLISIAFCSKEWFGWYSLIPIIFSFVWIWINPRLFPGPKNTNNWASMGTFGERVYLDRKNEQIAAHHRWACQTLKFLSALRLRFFVYGLYSLDIWTRILGNVWTMAFKA